MSLPEQFRSSHPEFPWLDPREAGPVIALMQRCGWLAQGETVTRVDRAGEGNMNLTLRVDTDRRSLVLKQARPWVEKYDMIPAPWDRSVYEQRFYERAAGLPTVAARMPRLLGADAAAHCLLLEFCPGARDLSSVYQGERLDPEGVEALAVWLADLHEATRGAPDPDFSNLEMRRLNHEHIFRLPIAGIPGFDLERFEPQLTRTAEAIRADVSFTDIVVRTGERYLASGPCLVHGDFFPGSWLATTDGVRVIDPEFCYWGDPEFDLACVLAHLALSGHDRRTWDAFSNAYRSAARSSIDTQLVARFAGIEVMRRVIGVAQLPIPPSQDGRRRRLLERARAAVLDGSVSKLYT